MVGSIVASVLGLALLAVVVGGLFSDTALSVNGWPGDRPGVVDGTASPTPSVTHRGNVPKRPIPEASRGATRATPTRSPSAAPSEQPTTGRTASPRPSPTREPTARPTPSAEPTTEPTTEPTETGDLPPGLEDKTPPGHDPSRPKGPKQ
jgi:hypothetical protein